MTDTPPPFLSSRPPESGKGKPPYLLIFILVMAGLVGITAYSLYGKFQMWSKMGPPDFGPAGVIVTLAESRPFSDRIEAIGTAQANESADITATQMETVDEIHFEEGQLVKAGTLLVELRAGEENAAFEEARKAYTRNTELARMNAGSIARKDEAKAALDVARARRDDRRVVAPFDGIVGLREVSVGDLVSPGTVITTLDDLDPIKLEFSVPEQYLSVLESGLEVKASTTAFPGEPFTGVIHTVEPRVNPQTRAVRVRAFIDNPDSRLRPGLLMSVAILRNERQSIAVPEEAISSIGDTTSITRVIEKDGQPVAENVAVTLGARRAGYVEILSGLAQGDKVIIEGGLKAQPGAPVTIKETRSIETQVQKAIDFATDRKEDAMTTLQEQGDLPAPAAPPTAPLGTPAQPSGGE